MTGEHPALPLRLELSASLSPGADPSNRVNAAIRRSVELSVDELLNTLGIPARSSASIVVGQVSERWSAFRLSVGEIRLRYPPDLLPRVYSSVCGQPLDPPPDPDKPDKIVDWLRERCGPGPHAEVQPALEFLSLACAEILKCQPAALFGPEQAGAYTALLPPPQGSDASPPWSDADAHLVKEVLDRVLALGISIADRQTVANVLGTGQADARSPVAIAEALVEALRPDTVEIRAPRAFLQELTTTTESDGPGMFPFLREGLFEELGVEFPRFRFVALDSLKPRTFSFKLNHLVSLPLRGLDPNQLLVNDTAERLALIGIRATPTTNPVTGQPCSLIDGGAGADAGKLGLTTWTALQHVVLCFAAHLRQNGHTLIHRAWVQGQMQKLRLAFRSLLATVRARWSDDEITGVLRNLVREGVSVRNLPTILERLIELDRARKLRGAPETPWQAHALEHPLAFVRIGLGREIAYKAGRQTNTIVVYLLDPAIERILADSTTALGDNADRILQAFHTEFASLPATAQVPHILTAIETRRAVQELVRPEFPGLSVIAHEELPAGTNVQPIARISMQ